jgi:hypothetical protein
MFLAAIIFLALFGCDREGWLVLERLWRGRSWMES